MDTLDVVPLRSLVAVASCGGFHRAAAALHLSQSAVSQHVRRLEQVVGAPLVERSGRRTTFTPRGEALIAEARRLLDLHDDILNAVRVPRESATLVLGSTEHGAEQILPEIIATLDRVAPDTEVRIRLDRTARVSEALAAGRLDLAVILKLGEASPAQNSLRLEWYAAPDWKPPAGEPVPLVQFDPPCVLRPAVLDLMAASRHPFRTAVEVGDLAGGQSAARSGLGAILLPVVDSGLEGLRPVAGLPEPPPVRMVVQGRDGVPGHLVATVQRAVDLALSDTERPLRNG
ncbi:LysR family transcriptional regulator [Arthrobacter sp. NPDC090010]|uniref:LysR family transcriptional regulator n=1 Tax=Arthrobacter sp. NPDC090010 TaxID=3363942 RepID=UPI003800C6F0